MELARPDPAVLPLAQCRVETVQEGSRRWVRVTHLESGLAFELATTDDTAGWRRLKDTCRRRLAAAVEDWKLARKHGGGGAAAEAHATVSAEGRGE